MVPVRRYWLSLLVIAPLFMCGSGGGTGGYGLPASGSSLNPANLFQSYGQQGQTPSQQYAGINRPVAGNQNPFQQQISPASFTSSQSQALALSSAQSQSQASSSSSSVAQSQSQALYSAQGYGPQAPVQQATAYQNQPQTPPVYSAPASYAPQAQPIGPGGFYGPMSPASSAQTPAYQSPPKSPQQNYSAPANAPAQCVCPQSPSQTPPPCTTPSPSSPSSPPLSIDNLCPTLDKIMDPTLCIVNTLSSSLKQLMGLPLGLSNLLAIISDIIDEVSGFLGDSVPAVCLLLTRPVNDDTVNNFCDPLATFINNLVEILSTAGVPIQSPPDNICKLLKGLTPTLPTLPSAIPNVTPAVPTVGDTSLPPVYK